MTIGIKILQLLQTKQSDCVENRKLIIELLKNGELDKLISNIDMNRKVQLINFKLFEKNQLNGLEQFVINLDAFISYFCDKLLVGGSFQYVLATIFLKSKYNYILLDNRFIYDGGENQSYYYSCFQKMMADQFLNNLLIMKFNIYPFLKHTNINVDKLCYSDKSYYLSYELLISLFLTNRSDIVVIISNLLINIRTNYITKNNRNTEYLDSLLYMWNIIFENFQDKFYYVTKLYSFKYLKYVFKNNLKNSKMYRILLKAKHVSSDRIQTMIVDGLGNIIFESNPKYIKSMLKYVILNKNSLELKHVEHFRKSKINFKDGTCLKLNNLIYPIYNSYQIIGYVIFLLPMKTSDNDREYMKIIIGDEYG